MNHFLAGGDDFTIAEFVESTSYSAKDVLMWEKTQGDFFNTNCQYSERRMLQLVPKNKLVFKLLKMFCCCDLIWYQSRQKY